MCTVALTAPHTPWGIARAHGCRDPSLARARGAGLQKALDKVPSAIFEKGIPGVREYSVGARVACVGVKFLEYSLAGMFCGLVGQGIANSAMMARRAGSPDAEFSVDPPPLLKTALVWGLFMGASSNLRYQAVFGLERLVDGTIARRIPQVRCRTTPLATHFITARQHNAASSASMACSVQGMVGLNPSPGKTAVCRELYHLLQKGTRWVHACCYGGSMHAACSWRQQPGAASARMCVCE